jgi:glucosamine--fructose-6-phosphate aminotransferase (isomerizing)
MCGLIGYIGKEDNVATLMHRGLLDLEYRGYDSWGIVCGDEAKDFFVKKAAGRISQANGNDFLGVRGTRAIGHSRWATHGGVTEVNAHPHFNKEGTIAVVHNGIIENHNDLRQFLSTELGIPSAKLFQSETDTEVIPHLIEYSMHVEDCTFEEAFVRAARRLEGRFAFVAMHRYAPYILAVRDGSPLVLGRGEGGNFCASDVPAFLDYTRHVGYMDDRQYAKIAPNETVIRDLDSGKKVATEFVEISWTKQHASKEGHPHFMLKEIVEQGITIDQAFRQDEAELMEVVKLLASHETFFIGCGTASKMAKLGELYMAKFGNRLAHSFVGSEFAPYRAFVGKKSLLFAVSQSGETADVLEALREGKKKGAKVVSLLNVVGSSMDRISDKSLFIHAGPEIAVASTKAATAQIAVLYLLAHATGGTLPKAKHELRGLAKDIRAWLTGDFVREVHRVAEKIQKERDIYIIGRGLNAPIAYEAAIKIQEVSYIHAEGFAGGELKHGPIALIDKGTWVIAFVPNDETKPEMESNIMELRSRGARVIGVAPDPNALFDEWIQTPRAGDASPIVNIIPIQLLAYHLAVLRGNDPDKPRNLAKSVTVK